MYPENTNVPADHPPHVKTSIFHSTFFASPFTRGSVKNEPPLFYVLPQIFCLLCEYSSLYMSLHADSFGYEAVPMIPCHSLTEVAWSTVISLRLEAGAPRR
jgi:hypothetical protein